MPTEQPARTTKQAMIQDTGLQTLSFNKHNIVSSADASGVLFARSSSICHLQWRCSRCINWSSPCVRRHPRCSERPLKHMSYVSCWQLLIAHCIVTQDMVSWYTF